MNESDRRDQRMRENQSTEADESPSRSRTPFDRIATVIGIATAILLLCCQVSWIAEPFDSSLGGVTSGEYYGLAARAFDRHGLVRLRLQPMLFFLENATEPNLPYLNHPPTPHLLTAPSYAAFGRDERALRVPLLGVLLAAMAALAIVMRRVDARFTWPALALFASTPMLFEYGSMVDAPMFSMMLTLPACGAWLAWRERPSRGRYATYAAWTFLGAACDWFGYFIFPAALFDLALRRPPSVREALRLVVLTGTPLAAGLASYFAWLFWVTGSVEGAFAQFTKLLHVPAGIDTNVGPGVGTDFATNMSFFLERTYGWWLLGLGGIGVVTAIARRRPIDRAALLLLLTGALPTLAFWSRAAVHEFWSLPAVPGVAVCAAVGLATITDGLARMMRADHARFAVRATSAVVLAVVVSRGCIDGIRLHDTYRSDANRELGRVFSRFAAPEDIVILPTTGGAARFYSVAPVVSLMSDMRRFEVAMDILAPAKDRIGRIWLTIPTHRLMEFAWAIELPRRPLSAKEFTYRVRIAGEESDARLTICELDKEACFALVGR